MSSTWDWDAFAFLLQASVITPSHLTLIPDSCMSEVSMHRFTSGGVIESTPEAVKNDVVLGEERLNCPPLRGPLIKKIHCCRPRKSIVRRYFCIESNDTIVALDRYWYCVATKRESTRCAFVILLPRKPKLRLKMKPTALVAYKLSLCTQ